MRRARGAGAGARVPSSGDRPTATGRGRSRDAGARVVARAGARERAAAWRAAGEKVVLATGVFDLLDVRHARHLAAARALGSRLIVGVYGDDAAARLEGPGRPVVAASDRARLVASLRSSDLVVVLEEPTVDRLFEELRPAVYARAAGHRSDPVREHAAARALGIEVAIAGDPERPLSRDLVERVRERTRQGPGA